MSSNSTGKKETSPNGGDDGKNNVTGKSNSDGEFSFAHGVSVLCEANGFTMQDFRDFCEAEDISVESDDSFARFCEAKGIGMRGVLFVQPTKEGPDAMTFDIVSAVPCDCPIPVLGEDGKYISDNGAPHGLVVVAKSAGMMASMLGKTTLKPIYSPSSNVYACVLGPLNDDEVVLAREALADELVGKYAKIFKAPRSVFVKCLK